MKLTMRALALTAVVSFVAVPFVGVARAADADDVKWVAQCIADNAEATVKVGGEVVAKYCACMNNKMSSNETQTITQWEKSHPTERKACEAAAGWN